MKHQFAGKTYSVFLMPTLLALLSGGCSTQQTASSSALEAQPSANGESKTIKPSLTVAPDAAKAAPVIEPKAMDALQKMGVFLQTLKTFEVSFKVSKDEVLESGQKIMVDGTSELTVQRPNRFHFSTKIEEAHRDLQFFYNGKTFTIYGNSDKFYSSVLAPGTIGELLSIAAERYNIEFPFADLFSWGTDKANIAAIQSAIYIGPTRINDVPCDHYAFRNEDVDWQLCIKQGETPLPLKLVITTKQEEGQPQYVSVMNWNLSPKINMQKFTFVPQKDSHKIEFAINEVVTESTK